MKKRRSLKKYRERMIAALVRDEYICQNCGRWTEAAPHHIIYKSRGGSDELENLVTLCLGCHTDVHGGRLKWGNK